MINNTYKPLFLRLFIFKLLIPRHQQKTLVYVHIWKWWLSIKRSFLESICTIWTNSTNHSYMIHKRPTHNIQTHNHNYGRRYIRSTNVLLTPSLHWKGDKLPTKNPNSPCELNGDDAVLHRCMYSNSILTKWASFVRSLGFYCWIQLYYKALLKNL